MHTESLDLKYNYRHFEVGELVIGYRTGGIELSPANGRIYKVVEMIPPVFSESRYPPMHFTHGGSGPSNVEGYTLEVLEPARIRVEGQDDLLAADYVITVEEFAHTVRQGNGVVAQKAMFEKQAQDLLDRAAAMRETKS